VAVAPGRLSVESFARRVYPGILVAITIALAADWLSSHYKAPVMLFALLFGMLDPPGTLMFDILTPGEGR